MKDSSVAPGVVAAFPAQFAAMEALLGFARRNRPTGPPTNDAAGLLVMATYARGTKTAQASFRLARLGYGAQAGMLNRSLFEDMIVAHWIRANPEEAPELFERHRQHNLMQFNAEYEKYGREDEVSAWPDLGEEERAALQAEFGRGHWTKKSLHALVKAVEHEWEGKQTDRRMLWQTFGIAHRFNNLILHHSFYGLNLAAEEVTADGVRWDVGHSIQHVYGALQVAWFSYVHLLSLVVPEDAKEAFGKLFIEHLPAFTSFRLPDDEDEEQPAV
jgi:hypothetical protein